MEQAEEATWIEDAKQGDAASFGRLVSAYQQKVFGFILGMVREESTADELTQKTFIKVWKGLPRFRSESRFQTWLFQIALNTTRSWGRWRKLRSVWELSLDAPTGSGETGSSDWLDVHADPSLEADPKRRLELEELRQTLAAAVERLPPQEKRVFVLRQYQDMPVKDVAQVLGIAEGSVKAHLSHALEKLRESLQERPDDL